MAVVDPASAAVAIILAALARAQQQIRQAQMDGGLGAGVELTPGITLPDELLPGGGGAAPSTTAGDMQDPVTILVETAAQPVRVLRANDARTRKKYAVQNLGPGEFHLLSSARAGGVGGFVILPDGFWSDDAPYAHQGEVYGWATLANTTIIVTEWT